MTDAVFQTSISCSPSQSRPFFELVELLDEHGPVSHQSSDGVRGSVSCLADFCDAAHHVLICEAVAVFWVEH